MQSLTNEQTLEQFFEPLYFNHLWVLLHILIQFQPFSFTSNYFDYFDYSLTILTCFHMFSALSTYTHWIALIHNPFQLFFSSIYTSHSFSTTLNRFQQLLLTYMVFGSERQSHYYVTWCRVSYIYFTSPLYILSSYSLLRITLNSVLEPFYRLWAPCSRYRF